jgi:hypothetical protein
MNEPRPSVETTDYDTAARFGARLNGVDFVKMICGVEFDLQFERWIDTRSGASVEERMISDLIGGFRDQTSGGVPWCLIFEFKSRPAFDVSDQLLGYRLQAREERPDRERGSRYEFLLFAVNLTGVQIFPEPRPFGTTIHTAERPPVVVNLSTFDAGEVLTRIENRELGFTVLPFTVLMQRGDNPEMIARWLRLLAKEPNAKNRGHYQAIARSLANCCGRYEIWFPHLKEEEMQLSRVALDWISKGREEGIELGEKLGEKRGLSVGAIIGQIQMLERFLGISQSPFESLEKQQVEELQARLKKLESEWQTRTSGNP